MADEEPTVRWQEIAGELFKRQEGETAIEIVRAAAAEAGLGDAMEDVGRTRPWRQYARESYTLLVGRDGEARPAPAAPQTARHTIVAEGRALQFLRDFAEPIDLLYLDGWPIGTADYQRRHMEAYRAAREKFRAQTIVLVADTDRDHGGKAALVLPEALGDGFQVLLWGRLTLLGRVNPAEVRDLLPRIGPPVPSVASLSDAIRLHQEGLAWEAEQLYRGILKQWPDQTAALHLLGVVRHQQGDQEAALRYIGKAIALEPTKAAYFNNYGAALAALGRHVESLACFRCAMHMRPDYADALSNLGMAQESLGQQAAALASYRKVLELRPQHLDTIKRLALLLRKQGENEKAVELYETALAAGPQPELCVSLGELLLGLKRPEAAAAQYQKATELKPDCAEAWFGLGAAQQELQHVPEARQFFDRAARLRPDKPFWRLRPLAAAPTVYRNVEEIDAYRAELGRTLDDWCASPRPPAAWHDLMMAGAVAHLGFSYHGRNNRQLKEKFATLYEPYFRGQPEPKGSGLRARRRIGIVVTQGHEGIFLRCMKGILQHLSPADFELVVLCPGGIVEKIRKEIGRDDLRFVAFAPFLREAGEQIRAAACDLIYYWEVGSDPMNYFLPFLRLAPVQCTSHGCQITSGVHTIDHFFSSALMETEASDAHYTEKLWRARTLLMNQPRLPAVSPVLLDYFRLPGNRHLYVCFQNPMKLHPDFDPLLDGILAADHQALIVLLGGRQRHMVTMLQERFAVTVPHGRERILFLPWLAFDDYCRLLPLADVILDPPHFGAGSSCYDIFSFNQPCVTLPGELIVGRVAYAFYKKMGLDELIASSPQDYVSRAVRLAGDRDCRLAVKERLQSASELVFNDLEAVREHERFFSEVLSGR